LSEWTKVHQEARTRRIEQVGAQIQEILDRLTASERPVHVSGRQDDVTDYEGWRIRLRDRLKAHPETVSLLAIACDQCQIPLIDTDKGSSRMSRPPCFQASCAGCGWIGYLPTEARRA